MLPDSFSASVQDNCMEDKDCAFLLHCDWQPFNNACRKIRKPKIKYISKKKLFHSFPLLFPFFPFCITQIGFQSPRRFWIGKWLMSCHYELALQRSGLELGLERASEVWREREGEKGNLRETNTTANIPESQMSWLISPAFFLSRPLLSLLQLLVSPEATQ